jgi:hypothetical protein
METLDGAVLCVARDLTERRDDAAWGMARRWGRWAMTNGMRLVVLTEPHSSLLLPENGRVQGSQVREQGAMRRRRWEG